MEKQLWQIMLIRLKEISINIQKNEERKEVSKSAKALIRK